MRWIYFTAAFLVGFMASNIHSAMTIPSCDEWEKTVEIAEKCYKTNRCRVSPADVAEEIRARNHFYEYCTDRREK